jgi:flagellar protein FliO/FliZ
MDFFELIRAVAALAITLGLIGLAGVALRKFGPDAMSRMVALRRDRRMQVVETLVLDPTRRLVLFTLDGEERLLMLGEGQLLDWGPRKAKKKPPAPPKTASGVSGKLSAKPTGKPSGEIVV